MSIKACADGYDIPQARNPREIRGRFCVLEFSRYPFFTIQRPFLSFLSARLQPNFI